MNHDDVQVGSTVTNGSSALRITERVKCDPRYKTSGWRGMCIPLEEFGGNRGMSSFVPDYLLSGWKHVPFEWRAIPGNMEERYVWEPQWRWLNREVRRAVQPTVDGIRGHVVTTPEEDEERRRLMTRMMGTTLREEDIGLTEAGVCLVDNATGWCRTHERLEG
jgi:hypothetical protein